MTAFETSLSIIAETLDEVRKSVRVYISHLRNLISAVIFRKSEKTWLDEEWIDRHGVRRTNRDRYGRSIVYKTYDAKKQEIAVKKHEKLPVSPRLRSGE